MSSSIRRGQPNRIDRLPLGFESVDAGWLTDALQHRYPGAAVTGMRLLGSVQGHTSKVRYGLDLNRAAIDAGLPGQVCLKANLTGDPLSSNACVNEARFYGLFRSRLDLPAPHCFLADWDDDTDGEQGLILLEDLVPLGGVFGASGQFIEIDAMASSLEELARLHGTTWGLEELDRQTWLQPGTHRTTAGDDYWTLMKDYIGPRGRHLDHLAVFPDWVKTDPERLHRAYLQLCDRETADTSPLCLVHGDAHIGNSYLRPDGTRMWFDWQIVRKARPWRDVTYFLVGSLTVEQRRSAERDLVRHYCECLSRHGVDLDVDTAWNDYRRWVLWGIIAWHLNINPNEDTIAGLTRFCVAADDLDTASFYSF